VECGEFLKILYSMINEAYLMVDFVDHFVYAESLLSYIVDVMLWFVLEMYHGAQHSVGAIVGGCISN
jgi:hypothetical protein